MLDATALFLSRQGFYLMVAAVLLIPIIIFAFAKRQQLYALRIWFYYVVTMFITTCVVELLKGLVAEPRPAQTLHNIVTLATYGNNDSFPSMHAALAFVIAMATYQWNRRLGIVLLVWASLVSLSRIYIGVHYPIDVVVGSSIGIIIALALKPFFFAVKQVVEGNQG